MIAARFFLHITQTSEHGSTWRHQRRWRMGLHERLGSYRVGRGTHPLRKRKWSTQSVLLHFLSVSHFDVERENQAKFGIAKLIHRCRRNQLLLNVSAAPSSTTPRFFPLRHPSASSARTQPATSIRRRAWPRR